jgi:hypothetical protein
LLKSSMLGMAKDNVDSVAQIPGGVYLTGT